MYDVVEYASLLRGAGLNFLFANYRQLGANPAEVLFLAHAAQQIAWPTEMTMRKLFPGFSMAQQVVQEITSNLLKDTGISIVERDAILQDLKKLDTDMTNIPGRKGRLASSVLAMAAAAYYHNQSSTWLKSDVQRAFVSAMKKAEQPSSQVSSPSYTPATPPTIPVASNSATGTTRPSTVVSNPTPTTRPPWSWGSSYGGGGIDISKHPWREPSSASAKRGVDVLRRLGPTKGLVMQTKPGETSASRRALDHWGPVKTDEMWEAWDGREAYFKWVLEENDVQGYWGRLVEQGADWPLWLTTLQQKFPQDVSISKEVIQWVELTSTAIDTGFNGAGNDGYKALLETGAGLGPTAAPVGFLLYALAFVKPYEVPIEKIFKDPANLEVLFNRMQPLVDKSKSPSLKSDMASFKSRVLNNPQLAKEVGLGILLLKLCDESRGSAWNAAEDVLNDPQKLADKVSQTRYFSLAKAAFGAMHPAPVQDATKVGSTFFSTPSADDTDDELGEYGGWSNLFN